MTGGATFDAREIYSRVRWWQRLASPTRRAILGIVLLVVFGSLFHVPSRMARFGGVFRFVNLIAWFALTTAATVALIGLFAIADRWFGSRGRRFAEGVTQLVLTAVLVVIFGVVASEFSSDEPPTDTLVTDGGLALFTGSPVKHADLTVNVQPAARSRNIPLLDVSVAVEAQQGGQVTVMLVGSGGLSPIAAWIVPFTNEFDTPVLGESLLVRDAPAAFHVQQDPSGSPYSPFVFTHNGASFYTPQRWFDPATARSVSFQVPAGRSITLLLRVANPITEVNAKFEFMRGGVGTIGCANALVQQLGSFLDSTSAGTLATGSLFVPADCSVSDSFGADPSGGTLTVSRPPTKHDSMEWDDHSTSTAVPTYVSGSELTASPIRFTIQLPNYAHSPLDRIFWLALIGAGALAALTAGVAALAGQRYDYDDETRTQRLAEAAALAVLHRQERERTERVEPTDENTKEPGREEQRWWRRWLRHAP
jgi:hypothetical protein